MPRPLRPIGDGLVYHVINRGNNRRAVFENEGDFRAFLKAIADSKERRPFDLYGNPAVRRWSAYVHAEPEEAELAGIRRSSATGLPYREAGWVNRLAGRLNLDLTIRPRGRPRKDIRNAGK